VIWLLFWNFLKAPQNFKPEFLNISGSNCTELTPIEYKHDSETYLDIILTKWMKFHKTDQEWAKKMVCSSVEIFSMGQPFINFSLSHARIQKVM
jgi:hypothetical protein